ncbi:MAG: helix-turn-helix domain-containing protein [Patescibacteria group bacterium]
MEKRFFSTIEVAEILGISRVAVFKKIKSGEIPAKRAGRNFIIDKKDMPAILGVALTKHKKGEIEASVKKTVKEYGRALELLGRE